MFSTQVLNGHYEFFQSEGFPIECSPKSKVFRTKHRVIQQQYHTFPVLGYVVVGLVSGKIEQVL